MKNAFWGEAFSVLTDTTSPTLPTESGLRGNHDERKLIPVHPKWMHDCIHKENAGKYLTVSSVYSNCWEVD